MVQAGEFAPYLQAQKRPSSAASQAVSSVRQTPSPPPRPGSSSTVDAPTRSSIKQSAALDLWNKWAVDNLGPMSSKPSADELNRKSSHLKRIIRESEKLTASVNNRINSMAEVRAELSLMAESSLSVASQASSRNSKTAIRKSRQSARRSMNDFLKHEGQAEAAARPATADAQSVASGRSFTSRPSLSSRIGSRPGSPTRTKAPSRPHSPTKSLIAVDSASTVPDWERESMRASIRAAERETAEQMGEKEELLATVDLLRAKLHAQDIREIENQRRLQHYDKLEPIFNRLGEKFHFKSAEEVIDRLEFLENDKLSTYDQLLEAQSEIRRLEKQLKDHRLAKESHKQAMENEHHAKVSKVQKQLSEARSEVENLGMELRSNTQRLEMAQRLSNAVINLWNKMHDNSEVMKQKPLTSDDIPVREPLHMVQCMYELMTMHSTVATSVVMRDINLVCNRVWSKFFRTQINMKGNTLLTITNMEEWMLTMDHKLIKMQHNLDTIQSKEKVMLSQNAKLQRQIKSLEAEIEKRDSLARQSIRVVNAVAPRPGQICPNCKEVVGRKSEPALPSGGQSSAALPSVPEDEADAVAGDESSVFVTEYIASNEAEDDKPRWSSSINLNSKQRRPASAVVRPSSAAALAKKSDEAQRPNSANVAMPPAAEVSGKASRPSSAATSASRPLSAQRSSALAQRPSSSGALSSRKSDLPNASRGNSAGRRNETDDRKAVGPMGAHWDAMLRAGHSGSVDFSSDASAALARVKAKPLNISWGQESKARRGGLFTVASQPGA